MKHTGLTGLTKKQQPWKSPRMRSVNQKETRRTEQQFEEMHAIYHDKDSKRIGTTYSKETVYKDIHIHVLIKTVEGQKTLSDSKGLDANRNTSSMPTREIRLQ